jgi:hypothetical protein
LHYFNGRLGIGDWGLGIGDWGLGIGPNPQSPIPNPHPQSPINKILLLILIIKTIILIKKYLYKSKYKIIFYSL